MIEGYFQIIGPPYEKSYGMYCIVLETDDKYEIWSNLKILESNKNNNFNNIPKRKRYYSRVITIKPDYSWRTFLSDAEKGKHHAIQFIFSNEGIWIANIAGNFDYTINHSIDPNDFVFLGSVIKK